MLQLAGAARAIVFAALIVFCGDVARAQTEPAEPPETAPAALIFATNHWAMRAGYVLRQVDLDSGSFGETRIDIDFGGFGGDDRIRAPRGNALRGLHLLIARAPPGDYVLSASYRNDTNGVSHSYIMNCMNDFGVVIRVHAGVANVVRSNEVAPPAVPTRMSRSVSDAALLAAIEQGRQERPDVEGEVIIAKPLAAIRWSRSNDAVSVSACESADRFEIVRRFGDQ